MHVQESVNTINRCFKILNVFDGSERVKLYSLKYELYERKILIQTSTVVQSHSVQVNSIFSKHEKGGTNGLLCDHKYNYSMHTYWKRQVKAKIP